MITNTEAKEIMLHYFVQVKEEWPGWYESKMPPYCGTDFQGACAEVARRYFAPLPSISIDEAQTLLSHKGRRLDINPPMPSVNDFEPAAQAAANIPTGEIRLNSQRWQHVSTMIDVVAMGGVFDYRRQLLNQYHAALANLPCSVSAAACGVVRQVWEGAVLMGPSMSYQVFISPRMMIEWAKLGNGCTVLQFDNLYEAWIIPNGHPQVFAMQLGDPNGTGSLPAWVKLTMRPEPDVTVGWLK